MSRLAAFYGAVYAKLCGTPPIVRPWHFQWLATKDLVADLRRVAPGIEGRVLDVGCGDKPYQRWFTQARGYIGIDIAPGPQVDAVIEPGANWPLPDASFDAVLCTQVLEHVADLAHVLREIDRVLRPGGVLIVSVPFAYNEHGIPHDYRRLSAWGVQGLFADRYDILELKRQGGIGSTAGTLCLNWFEMTTARHRAVHIVKALLLPVWIVVCALANALGAAIDAVDATGAYYGNVLLRARKRGLPRATASPAAGARSEARAPGTPQPASGASARTV